MKANNVNREEQPSQVLSVRLSKRQFKRLQVTLRNFDIRADSLSEQLRILFERFYHSSVRWRRRWERAVRESNLRSYSWRQPLEDLEEEGEGES